MSTPPNAADFFGQLGPLSPLRIISRSGPSTFEAICRFDEHAFQGGFMNAITPAYHWHLQTDGLRYVRSHDTIHKRSGRRVMFFELREKSDEPPFLMIYLYRGKGEEFDEVREKHFAVLHQLYGEGVELAALPQADTGDSQ